MKTYELYKGYELLASGTIAEIAEKLGVTQETVRFYGTPTHQRRVKENGRMLMRVDRDEE
jgi:predicted transcriptional regulator